MVTQTKIPPPTVSNNPWWGHDPSDKQLVALWAYAECPNLFYGGAAGPGRPVIYSWPPSSTSSIPTTERDTPQDLR